MCIGDLYQVCIMKECSETRMYLFMTYTLYRLSFYSISQAISAPETVLSLLGHSCM